MSDANGSERVQAAIESVMGVRLPIAPPREATAGAHITEHRGEWLGDVWQGAWAASMVSVQGLLHPEDGRLLTVQLDFSEHDLSNEVTAWDLTLGGFHEHESAALRKALDPHGKVRDLNPNTTYRWVVDGRAGSTPPPAERPR